MALKLEIVTPEKIVHQGEADSVILPTVEGQVGILPGHLPLMTKLETGELQLVRGGQREFFVVDGGYARLCADTLSVLTEGAIGIEHISLENLSETIERAHREMETARLAGAGPAEIEKFESITRFAVAQRLAKGKPR